MERVNIFCLIGGTGSGKTTYLNMIKNSNIINELNMSILRYGTTRPKRENESDEEYYFCTNEFLDSIDKNDIIECREYNTKNNGLVKYFTLKDYIQDGNIICTTSMEQYESYYLWSLAENKKNKNKRYYVYSIMIHTNLRDRVKRLIDRAETNNAIYEACRRINDEKTEFEDVLKRINLTGSLYIDNTSINNTLTNLEKIKMYIIEKINRV